MDNNLNGTDNRGGTGALALSEGVTFGDGSFWSGFTVAHQPGDNHRVAATLKQSALNMLNDNNVPPSESNPRTGAQVPTFIGHISPLLTAWRKLHLELAAMQRPTFTQNRWSGNWAGVTQSPGIPNRIIFEIDDLPIDNNQLEGGWIQIQGAGLAGLTSFRVFESLDTALADTVTAIMPAGIGILGGVTSGTFIVSDDDISDQALFDAGIAAPGAPGSYGADVTRFGVPLGPSLPMPETTGLDTLYAPAYILPVVDGINSGVVAFTRNLPDVWTDSYFNAFAAIRSPANPISTPAFRTALLGTGFQSDHDEDADPEVQVTKGANPHGDGDTNADSRTGVCVVFIETIDDAGGVAAFRIAAHELAHTLGVPHDPAGTGGLMEKYPDGAPVFLPANLKRLRDYVEP